MLIKAEGAPLLELLLVQLPPPLVDLLVIFFDALLLIEGVHEGAGGTTGSRGDRKETESLHFDAIMLRMI